MAVRQGPARPNPAKPTPCGPATGPITGSWPSKPTRVCAALPGRCGGTASSTESGNLRAALDWYIATGDADAALSLASGMAWLWFINGDFLEGARWLGDALGAEGPRRPEVEATAHVWRGYCVGMSTHPAAGVIECEEAVAVLRTSHDRVRLAEALVVCATVLGFAHHFDRSLEALAEARDLLDPAGHGWLLAAHDLIVAWNLLSLGRLEDAEPVARSSLERFDAAEEVLVVVSPLNALASIAEARGDLEAASAAYEALVAAMPGHWAAHSGAVQPGRPGRAAGQARR